MPRLPPVVPFIQTGNPEMDRLQRFVAQALPGRQDRWSAPTLLNGWVNLGGAEAIAAYRKDSTGTVWIKGLVKSGSAPPSIVFTLPIGYRPTENRSFAARANAGAADILGVISIRPNGDVWCQAGGTTYFALECAFAFTG